MIKRTYVVVCLFFAMFIIGFSVKTAKNNNDGMLKVESVPLHNSRGWGYEIMVDHKIFIHQEYIPAISGKKAFFSEEDAMKTAGLVVQKLVKGKPVAITRNDLDSLKISFQ